MNYTNNPVNDCVYCSTSRTRSLAGAVARAPWMAWGLPSFLNMPRVIKVGRTWGPVRGVPKDQAGACVERAVPNSSALEVTIR